jgi:hypothetical protein
MLKKGQIVIASPAPAPPALAECTGSLIDGEPVRTRSKCRGGAGGALATLARPVGWPGQAKRSGLLIAKNEIALPRLRRGGAGASLPSVARNDIIFLFQRPVKDFIYNSECTIDVFRSTMLSHDIIPVGSRI